MPGAIAPETAAFRPLLKWPGGKRREWGEIGPRLPRTIRHFVDPFMGGLAPFALTRFTGRAWLNDRHERLVAVHRFAQTGDAEFLAAMRGLADAWDALGDVAASVARRFAAWVDAHRRGERPAADAADGVVRPAAADAGVAEAATVIAASVLDKAGRVARLETKHTVAFSPAAVAEHCETAVRAGFYNFVREREGAAAGAAPQAAADFLFLRDYCYGSMFRHNAEGAFNIPYGGTSYNTKSFASRLAQIRSAETRDALARATFSCDDFEPFLDRLRPELGPDDFVFADPPYDSDFKSYGPEAFGRAEHERLAAVLCALPCRWMLVIKETPFVRATYLRPESAALGVREVHAFGKEYGYNVRGRNERAVRHVIVANHAPPRAAQSEP